MYSDGTPMVKTAGWSRIVAKAHTIVVRNATMAEFVTAMFLVDAVNGEGGLIRRLVLPYVPGARQDRVNPTGDDLDTAWSVGKMIQQRFVFGDVVILDPHSPAVVKAIASPIIYPQSEVAKKLPQNYDGIIAADKGGQARAEEMAKAMNLPVYYGGKTRDVSTCKLTGFTLDPLVYDNQQIHGAHYLVVDDICDGGGTFIGLVEKIAEQGATADLYVSHGIFSKGTDELKKHFGEIFTTDSREIHDRNDVTVIPVVNDMVKYQ